jgi:hypothetical protein
MHVRGLYGKQNIAYATVHNDEQTPHMHLGVVPMRDGKLQGKLKTLFFHMLGEFIL